ncbi:MAG: DUF3987 domain-containing protein [Phycisphaerae bacterium]
MSTMNSFFGHAAISYATELRWPVLPVHGVMDGRCTCGRDDCDSASKHPCTRNGLKDATVDVDQINMWWNKCPAANIGIRTGAESGIVVIDIDPRHGGDATLVELVETYGELPPTVECLTGGGGRHFYFRRPGQLVKSRSDLRPGIDVRGDSGYAVAPPSVHANGTSYQWVEGRAPGEIEIAELPAWLLEIVAPKRRDRTTTKRARETEKGHQLLRDSAERYVKKCDAADEGGRNAAAFSLAGNLAAFVTEDGDRLTPTEIVEFVANWNASNASPLPDGEIRSVVSSALKNGTPRKAHLVSVKKPKDDGTKTRPRPAFTRIDAFRPFPVHVLPARVREFVVAVSLATGTDVSFASMSALVVLAGCIGNRIAVQLKSGWPEPSVLWGVLLGRSGSVKSPVLRAVTRPLIEIYKQSRAALAEQRADYEVAVRKYEVEIAEWRKKQRDGQGGDPPLEPTEPVERRILVSDITIEKLGALLEQNPMGLLLVRDELAAWAGSFDRYASGGKGSDQPAWLSMYGADNLVIDRKSAASPGFVERAAVSVLGSIQPGTLQRMFGQAERESGLLARILVVYPPEKPALWTDASLPEQVERDWHDLIESIVAIEPVIDDTGNPRPRFLSLSTEARKIFIPWHDKHVMETAEIANDDEAAHASKLKGIAARIALVLACAEAVGGTEPIRSISDAVMQSAITIIDWFKHESRRVYDLFGESVDARARRRLVELVERKGGNITARALQQSDRRFRSSVEAAESALDELVQLGLGTWEFLTPTDCGGRPTREFVLAKSLGEDDPIRSET